MIAFLGALSYYGNQKNQEKIEGEPAFNFYSSSKVLIQIDNPNDFLVNGMFYNVIEGGRQVVNSKDSSGWYVLDFKVNSPRMATLYINNESFDIFIFPDSMLKAEVFASGEHVDSLRFSGLTAKICNYYAQKNKYFESINFKKTKNTLSSENATNYIKKLDSLTKLEVEYLVKNQSALQLPSWFVDYEKNEILYQRAYLKTTNVANDTLARDIVLLDNVNAVFSYSYYLYLNAYFSKIKKQQLANAPTMTESEKDKKYLAIADSILKTEAHDVFVTREIFKYIQKSDYDFARELLNQFGNFTKKKYYRFLDSQIKEEMKSRK